MPSIHVQMTNHQIAVARIFVLYLLPLQKRTGWFILLMVALVSLALRYAVYGDSGFESFAELALGALTLGGCWFLLVYTRERGNSAAARMYFEGFRLTQKEEGLEYRVGESAQLLKWSEFEKSERTQNWIFLYFNSRFALIIPRSSFDNTNSYREWAAAAERHITLPNPNS